MLDLLSSLKRGGSRPQTRAPRVPSGVRVYAVGDIHGRADLLDALLMQVDADAAERAAKRTLLVFLGDYIDRGPASSAVLERLSGLNGTGREAYFLLGNHEEALMRILGGDSGLIDDWLRFGGRECLLSYGADPDAIQALPPTEAVEAIGQAIPAAHRAFLEACDDSVTIGDYLFVHAGIRPGLPLSAQKQSDLRWIREPFLACRDDHGVVVVHGHSIREEVDWQDNRIGIDTGAYRTGVLTALVLSGSRRRAIQARIRAD